MFYLKNLREIAELRVAYQDVTLKELGEMVSGGNISKSGINHRLRKIDEIADKFRKVNHLSMQMRRIGILSNAIEEINKK